MRAPGARPLDARPGLIAAALVFFVYGGLALSVDFPRAAFGFQSDEATYYMMGHSLADDGDLDIPARRPRTRLARVSERSGGRVPEAGTRPFASGSMPRPLSSTCSYGADPDKQRLYYGKSFIYPLFASPFVWLFGTNGFLVLHALLLALAIGAATCSSPRAARRQWPLLLATAFLSRFRRAGLFRVDYAGAVQSRRSWSSATSAGSYKEVASPASRSAGMRWLFSRHVRCPGGACSSDSRRSRRPPNALLFVADPVRPALATPLASGRGDRHRRSA